MGKTPGESTASMSGSTNQQVWGNQTPYLENMYQQGQNLSQAPNPDQAAAQQAGRQFAEQAPGQVYDPLAGSYNQAFGPSSAYNQAAAGLTPAAIQGLSDMATAPSTQGSTPLLDKNVAMALEQASQNFQRNVAPSIKRDAVAMGQYGGTRGDLALGTAASDANEQALRAAMGAYQDQYNQDIQAKALQDQNRLAATQQIQNIMAGQAGNVGLGAQAGGQLMNLGMGQSDIYNQVGQMPWQNLQNYQQILGSPTVLGSSNYSGFARTDAGKNTWTDPGGFISRH